MSFLAAFKKRKPDLTFRQGEMDIKTLDSALERIGTLTDQIQGLQKTILERDETILTLNSDFLTCMEGFGITKNTIDGITNWESSQLNDLKGSVSELSAERNDLTDALTAANTRIAELEKSQKTVSMRAMEFLATQGGKQLPVSANGVKPSNKAQLIDALDAANRAGNQDEMARLYAEIKKLK